MNGPTARILRICTARWSVTILTVLIVVLRKSDSLIHPQFWAEDGGLFFIEAERYGGWGQLFQSYEGYLHLLPRLIAALGAWLPLPLVPAFYAWNALAVTGVMAWWLQSPRVAVSVGGGMVAALALAAVPHTGEVYLNICNLQWITALGLFALTLSADATCPKERLSDLSLLILTGLTGPFILLTLPLFLWRVFSRRSAWSVTLFLAAIACAAAHAPSLLAHHSETFPQPWAPVHHAAIIGRRVIATLFLGQISLPEILCTVLCLGGFTALVLALWRRRAKLPGGLIVLCAAVLVLASTAYKVRPDLWTLSELVNGDRYFFIPKVIVLWLLAAVAASSLPRARLALTCLIILPLAANISRFIFTPAADQNWAVACAAISRGQPVWVPILPEGTNILHPGRRP